MATIHLIRHGQAAFGERDYDCLSPTGQRQALTLGQALAARWQPGDRVVCGGMRRHQQTAQGCAQALGREPVWEVDERWNEFDHEEVLTRFRPEFADHDTISAELLASADPKRSFQLLFESAMARWTGGQYDADYRESWSAFRQRCRDALRTLVADLPADATAWVFTSGGPIASVVQDLLAVPDRQALSLSWSIVNASVTKLTVGRRGPRLSTFNGYAHFENGSDDGLITYR